jgi:UDP-N-acetylmuramate dehydrogenase
MNEITEQLRAIFGDRLKENEPMSKHTNFRIGGPAKWFAEVKSIEELTRAIAVVRETPVSFYVLGGGSNTLVSDEGIDGLVLQMAMRDVKIDGTTVTVGAGAISAGLARQSAEAGLAGFEWAISLPGTIGGATRGNAGCFGGEMKDSVRSVRVWRDGALVELSPQELNFAYRDSAIKHSNDIIVEVTLELRPGDREALKAKLAETLGKRKMSQPLYAGSAGCMFKNYEIKNDEELDRLKDELMLPPEMAKKMQVSCGWLIDRMDLKGKQIGGAQISPEHGNFIINSGAATASDVLQLISVVKTAARERYGIQLHEEVQLIGF